MNKILAYVDLLGFSRMVKLNHLQARTVLNDFYNICFSVIKTTPQVRGSLFSDSLLVHSEDYPALINCVTKIYRRCLLKNDTYNALSDFFLLPRGAVSVGIVNIEEREDAPNLTKGFIVSPALVHSAELEKSIKGSRLLIAVNKNNNESQAIVWNQSINSILYENTSFELWKNYKYQDSLWFRDITKTELAR